jgi:hypothetical protein
MLIGLNEYGCKKMEDRVFGQSIIGIYREESKAKLKRAIELKNKNKNKILPLPYVAHSDNFTLECVLKKLMLNIDFQRRLRLHSDKYEVQLRFINLNDTHS